MFVQPSSGFLGRCEARTGRVLLHSQSSEPAANKDLHWSWWVGWASARTTVGGGYALYAGGLVNMRVCVCVCAVLCGLFSAGKGLETETLSWGRRRFKWAINQTEANEQLMALDWDSKHPMNSHLKLSVRWNRAKQVISEQGTACVTWYPQLSKVLRKGSQVQTRHSRYANPGPLHRQLHDGDGVQGVYVIPSHLIVLRWPCVTLSESLKPKMCLVIPFFFILDCQEELVLFRHESDEESELDSNLV